MADVIATVWDFDKTLIPGYMQEPIFERYGVDGKAFWARNNARIRALREKQFEVNADTYYLNELIREARDGGSMNGLNNEALRELGKELRFCDGAVGLFRKIHELNREPDYQRFGIRFENYIVSTGLRRMIEGSSIARFVTKIWGAELVDETGPDGVTRLSEVGYSLDNTSKTRALFEINKGVGIEKGSTIDVNTQIPEELRRVQFCNMIYVADGPSDIPAFSVMLKNKGATMAVYPPGDEKAFHQVNELRRCGRVQMVAEAKYRKGSAAYMWVMDNLQRQAAEIMRRKLETYKLPAGTPSHLI